MIPCAHQVKVQAPCISESRCNVASRLPPTHRRARHLSYSQFSAAPARLGSQLESIEVVFFESRTQDSTHFLKVHRGLQLFCSPSNRQIVHKNLPLAHSPLRHSPQFTELQISEMLHSHPNASS